MLSQVQSIDGDEAIDEIDEYNKHDQNEKTYRVYMNKMSSSIHLNVVLHPPMGYQTTPSINSLSCSEKLHEQSNSLT